MNINSEKFNKAFNILQQLKFEDIKELLTLLPELLNLSKNPTPWDNTNDPITLVIDITSPLYNKFRDYKEKYPEQNLQALIEYCFITADNVMAFTEDETKEVLTITKVPNNNGDGHWLDFKSN